MIERTLDWRRGRGGGTLALSFREIADATGKKPLTDMIGNRTGMAGDHEVPLGSLTRAMFETALDAIIMIDHEGRIMEFNPAAETIFGHARSDVLGQPMQGLIVPEHMRDGHSRGLARYLETRESQILGRRLRLEALGADGVEFPVELTVNRIPDLEPPVFVGAIRDISEQVSYEERLQSALAVAEEASTAKDDFIALLSHEMRTSMNGLLGMLQMLDGGADEHERAEFTTIARRSAEALLTIMDDILDFAKLESGTLESNPVAFDVGALVRGVSMVFQPVAAAKGLSLHVTLAEELPEAVRADRARLRQILMNLVGNAVKFTDSGDVTVAVTRVEDTDSDAQWRFEVRDTGVGVAPDVANQIFEPFVQGKWATGRTFGGTGLGLAISRTMLEGMGGAIGFQSMPDEGSNFWFTLPLETVAAPQGADDSSDVSVALDHLDGIRVLVVDDSSSNRRVAQAMLEGVGCHVAFAKDGDAAVRMVADSGRYDVVLMDLNMPGLDGVRATERIRENGVTTPILSVTARPSEQVTSIAGFDGHVMKPILRGRLYRALIRALGLGSPVEDDDVGPESVHSDRRGLPVVDEAVLSRLQKEVGTLSFPAIAQDCLDELSARIADLTDVNLDHTDASRLIVHDLKTASGTLGATRLKQVIEDLEGAIDSVDTPRASDLRRAVLGEFAMAAPVLDQVRSRLASTPGS